jgi:pantetheine-phosphate adenylyltransferase
MKAIFPGSFDPITLGHMDIIDRASQLFDEVVVLIMLNPNKQYTFSLDERIEMIKLCTAHLTNVKVDSGSGLTVHYAAAHQINVLIRGIREVMDYEYEMQQATINMLMDNQIETFFLLSKPQYSFLSSSATKIVAQHGGDVSAFVPLAIEPLIRKKYTHGD